MDSTPAASITRRRPLRDTDAVSAARPETTTAVLAQYWDDSPLGLLAVDRQGCICYANTAASALLSASDAALLDRPVTEVLPGFGIPDQRSSEKVTRTWHTMSVRRPDGSASRVEIDVARGDVTLVTMRAAAPASPGNDEPTTGDARFDAFMDAVPAFAYIKDAEGRWLWMNRRLGETLGLQTRNLLGRHTSDVFPEYISEPLAPEELEVLATGTPQTMMRDVRSDSGTISVEAVKFAFHDASGRVLLGTVALDTSIQRATETGLQRRVELIDQMEALAKVGGWSLDLSDMTMTWSKGINKIYGLPDDFVPAPGVSLERYSSEARQIIEGALQRAIEDGTPWDIEVPVGTTSGKTIHVRSIGAPILEDGRPVRILGAFQDVTALRRARENLAALNADLEARVAQRTEALAAANKELASFSYSISHDLRAPLRAISGFASILERRNDSQLDDKGRHYLNNISSASQRMSTLIEALLDYSRLTRQPARAQAVDVNRIIEGTIDVYEERAVAADARLVQVGPVPAVFGDAALVGQILANLIENALTYRRPEVQTVVEISGRVEGDAVTIDVSDNGIGIGIAYHDRIFDVFQRLHTEDEYPGTGIGLANVRKAARRMDGDVTVRSEPGVGSTFTLRLPRATAAEETGSA